MPQNDSDGDQPVCDEQMLEVLKKMLREDVNITARAVAREHPSLKQASSVTRNAGRAELLGKFQQQQRELRSWSQRNGKSSRQRIATDLAGKDRQIAELQRKLEVLQAVIVAMIRIVGELGGMSRFLQLFEGYQEALNQLKTLGVLQEPQVKVIRGARADKPAETRS